jgi:hypothetical protein|tara:strand:- start:2517 stop:3011 length:495 start_codon:yes stop_codon:yes gene_type:complete
MTIRYKTYKNTLDTITCLLEAHKQIQTTTTGDIFDVDIEKNTKFPLAHVNIGNVDISMSQKTFNFQLFIMDIADEDNETFVLNEMLNIMSDIIALLKHGENTFLYNAQHGEEPRYFVDNDFTCEPFTERFDNTVSGWVCNIQVIIESVLDSCDIPIDDDSVCIK